MKRLLTLLLAIAPAALAAQTEITPFRPGVTADGICYFLPATRLHIALEARQVTYTPGEYAPYADLYLRIADVPQKAAQHWTLTSISVTPYGVADPSRAYTIRLKPKTSAPLVTLTPDGILLAVNAEATQPAPVSQPFTKPLGTNAVDVSTCKTPEMLAATSPRKAAELAAEEIYDIRDTRTLLTKSQADFMPKDGYQLQLMLQHLNAQEQALMQLFQGTADTTLHVFTFDVEPSHFDGTPQTLFHFSPEQGLLPAASDAAGAYTIAFTDEHTLPAPEPAPAGRNTKKEEEDLRYCVSGTAQVVIAGPSWQTLWQQSLPFSQIGHIAHLGGDLFNKKTTTHVLLHSTTGSILRLDAAPEN